MSHDIDTIPMDAVRINGGTQSRAALNETTIAEYAEAIRSAIDLPPVITYFDGVNFWLADGFHRYHAHRAAGAVEINSEIRHGTCREAVLFSVGANASHGLRRTSEDKRRAVLTLLNDSEWSVWSQEKIAKACIVSTGFVSKLANDASIHREEMKPAMRTVERNGKTYEQNTANIGKAKPTEDVPVGTASALEPAAAPDTSAPVPFDEVQALRDQLVEVSDSLKSTLADNEMMGRVFDADDKIKASMDEATRQRAIANCAETQYNGQQGKVVALTKQVTHWMTRAQKAEKALAKLEDAK